MNDSRLHSRWGGKLGDKYINNVIQRCLREHPEMEEEVLEEKLHKYFEIELELREKLKITKDISFIPIYKEKKNKIFTWI